MNLKKSDDAIQDFLKKITLSWLLFLSVLTGTSNDLISNYTYFSGFPTNDGISNSKTGLKAKSNIQITDDPYFKFDRLTKEDGLTGNYILDFLQDKYGFMWIATTDGLNRYDGVKIIRYQNIHNDTTSISDNLVTCLKEDESGKIWIGTKKGLNVFDRKSNSFRITKLKNPDGTTVELNEYIRAILVDNNSILWIETAKGNLIKYNTKDLSYKVFKHSIPGMVNTYFYHDIFKDMDGGIWCGGRFMGILRFNPVTEKFYSYRSDEKDNTKKRESDVASYFQLNVDTMCVAGIDGLYFLNTKTEVFNKILRVSTFTIKEDSRNILWIGTGSGLYLYNKKKHSFVFIKNDGNNPFSLIKNQINKIYIDNFQNVWIGTIDGISIYRPSKNKFRHIYHIPEDERTPTLSHITSIVQLDNGEILLGTEKSGIDCVDEHFIKKCNYSAGLNNLVSDKISVLMKDSDRDIWVGSWSGRGFNIINPDSYKIKSYSLLKSSLKADWYNDIFEDSNGNFWIGIWGGLGLYQFDKQRGVFKDVFYNLKYQIDNSPVRKIEFDGRNLWIGLKNQSSFFAIEPKTEKVTNYLKNNYSSFDFNKIKGIYRDKQNNIWFWTSNGIYRKKETPYISFKKTSGIPTHFSTAISTMPFLKEYQIDTILCEVTCENGSMWIGTTKGIFNVGDNKVIGHYSKSANQGLSSDTIWSMVQTDPENIWLGTEAGLCRFHLSTKEFFAVAVHSKDYLSSHLIKCVAEDRDGIIWAGTTNKGLNRIDPVTQKVKQFQSNLEDTTALWGDLVNDIFVSNGGTVWVGAFGLNKLNSKTMTFSHFTEQNGLADNNVMSILEDSEGKMWISTLNGLSVFDPVTETFKNFYEKDGLQGNEFTNAACRLKSGKLLFGGKNGISVCDPENMHLNDIPPQISFVSFSVFDKKKDINFFNTKRVTLNYDENYFSVEFAVLDFSNPESVEYAYKLENAEQDWNYTTSGNRIAKYTNIDPGEYKLIVKATNSDGVWNEAGTFINIKIRPPFWKTAWFVFFEILALLFVIVLIIKYREKKIIEQNKFQLLEQKLLRSQMNPHFIFNSLSSIQSFIFDNDPVEAGAYLSQFAELIRSILYNSREEFITIDKEVKMLKNYFELQQLRYSNKFEYKIDIDPSIQPEIIKIPPMLVQPFIENAIEHGIKYISEMGQIDISFTLIQEKDAILLTIEDNGVGIAASKKLKNSNKKDHTSLATVIANERISVLNKGRKKNYFHLEVSDVFDNEGVVQGVRVKFIIPYRKHLI